MTGSLYKNDLEVTLATITSEHAAENNHLCVVLLGEKSTTWTCQQCDGPDFDSYLHEHDGKAVFFNGVTKARESR